MEMPFRVVVYFQLLLFRVPWGHLYAFTCIISVVPFWPCVCFHLCDFVMQPVNLFFHAFEHCYLSKQLADGALSLEV